MQVKMLLSNADIQHVRLEDRAGNVVVSNKDVAIHRFGGFSVKEWKPGASISLSDNSYGECLQIKVGGSLLGEDVEESIKEDAMKVLRETEIETNEFKIGDRIKVNFSGEEHYATAIYEMGNKMLFLTDDCLNDRMPMNETHTTEGGWEKSLMRDKLQDIAENTDIKDMLVPFENGDLLTLLTEEEVFGNNNGKNQIPWFEDRAHRIATIKEDRDSFPWWLRSVVSATNFALVNSDGYASYAYAGNALGVRPAFAIGI